MPLTLDLTGLVARVNDFAAARRPTVSFYTAEALALCHAAERPTCRLSVQEIRGMMARADAGRADGSAKVAAGQLAALCAFAQLGEGSC